MKIIATRISRHLLAAALWLLAAAGLGGVCGVRNFIYDLQYTTNNVA